MIKRVEKFRIADNRKYAQKIEYYFLGILIYKNLILEKTERFERDSEFQ